MTGTVLHFDPAAGASGDMVLGALLDVGVPPEVVDRAVRAVGLDARTRVTVELRHGVRGLKVSFVSSGGQPVDPLESADPPARPVPIVVHRAAGTRGILRRQAAGAAGHGHHAWPDVVRRVSGAGLRSDVRDMALAILQRLAVAESVVHGIPLDEVALHEVAAVDSLADMVGAAAALCHLRPDRITCDAFGVCSGFIRMQHGNIPGPGPATGLLLVGAPVVGLAGRMETVTPTGAAILTTVAHAFGPPPAMTLLAQGFGLGRKDPPERANLLRVWLGEVGRTAHRVPPGDVVTLEANLDDMTPQALADATQRLLRAGALDAWIAPVVMKKGRPGWTLHVLCEPAREAKLVEAVLVHTTALGVRRSAHARSVAERAVERVRTPHGAVRVKVSRLDGRVLHVSPEHDDCARAAAAAGVTLDEVRTAALLAARPGPSRKRRKA